MLEKGERMKYQKKTETTIRCPLEYCLGILGGKWKFRIVCILSDKEELRYQDIRKDPEQTVPQKSR